MDRREIEHVEAHRPDRGQPRHDVVERPVAGRIAALERGNNSYQAAKPAAGRSASSGISGWCRTRKGLAAPARIRAAVSGFVISRSRSSGSTAFSVAQSAAIGPLGLRRRS